MGVGFFTLLGIKLKQNKTKQKTEEKKERTERISVEKIENNNKSMFL